MGPQAWYRSGRDGQMRGEEKAMRTRIFLVLGVLLFGFPNLVVAVELGNEAGFFVVADASMQFGELKHHGEALGWINPETQGAPDPSMYDHYQGVVRYPGTGIPVFYVTQLDDDDGGIEGGYLHVIQMGTRSTSGERLGSNLQAIGSDTEEMTPFSQDTWVRSIRFDGALVIEGSPFPAYRHPGGMAIADDVLFVPIDQPESSGDPVGQIVLFDLREDRLNPSPFRTIALDHAIDNLAVTGRPDGTCLIWTNGNGGNDTRFYRTSHPDLRDPALQLIHLQNWDPASGLFGTSWFKGAGAHQSSTFIREPDGTLYLIGMRHPGGLPFLGEDWADLFQVDELTHEIFTLTHIQSRHFYCVYDGGGGPVDMRICNFAAGGSAYVSPSGELILYSIPHDDEDGFDPDIVRMGEFRHRDVNREDSPLRLPRADAMGPYEVDEGGIVTLSGSGSPPADRPWVELYDDDGYRDRSIVVDYDVRHLLELENFNHLDRFNDKTSSVRWRAPIGLDIYLYDDDHFRDRFIVLEGTGKTEAISNLKTQKVVYGLVEHFEPFKSEVETLDFNDKTSSLRFVGSPPDFGTPHLEWDLDGDGLFGETGAAATRGDEVGNSPVFDATGLDGPTELEISLRVSFPGSSAAGINVTTIYVRNVPPEVEVSSISGGQDGIALVWVPVTLKGIFLDEPCDTHSAFVDWGDGSVTPAEIDEGSGTVTATHSYVSPGDYLIQLVVTDDDWGFGSANARLLVYDAAGAVDTVIGSVDALLTTLTDPAAVRDLGRVRDDLDGQISGLASDGAIDKLNSEDWVAALVKIEQALARIEAFETAYRFDLSAEKILLATAARSVAQGAFNNALAFIGLTPTHAQQEELDKINNWIAKGITALTGELYQESVRSFRFATARAVDVLE
jgi:hypothetical protein